MGYKARHPTANFLIIFFLYHKTRLPFFLYSSSSLFGPQERRRSEAAAVKLIRAESEDGSDGTPFWRIITFFYPFFSLVVVVSHHISLHTHILRLISAETGSLIPWSIFVIPPGPSWNFQHISLFLFSLPLLLVSFASFFFSVFLRLVALPRSDIWWSYTHICSSFVVDRESLNLPS